MSDSLYSFDEYSQAKVHVNLPFLTWELIANDINDFTDGGFTGGYSNFVNTIVINYIEAERYPTSLEEKFSSMKKYSKHILEITASVQNKEVNKKISKLEDLLFEDCRAQILEEFNVPKEEGKKIDLNNKARQLVWEVGMLVGREYKLTARVFDSVGLFIRAILLDYSRQSYDMRYRIYRQDTYDRIMDIIKRKRNLLVSFDDGTSTSIIPYGIESDDYHVHSYLIGLDEKKRDLNKIILRRFSSIKSVSCGENNVALTKTEHAEIKKQIREKGVSYLSNDTGEFVVYLSKKGQKDYRKRIYQRPNYLPQTEEEKEKNHFRFVCTEFQLKTYFQRFGAEAVIISPPKLHDKMLKEYEKAYKAYQKNK